MIKSCSLDKHSLEFLQSKIHQEFEQVLGIDKFNLNLRKVVGEPQVAGISDLLNWFFKRSVISN